MPLAKKTLFTRTIRRLPAVLKQLDLTPAALVGTALDAWCRHSYAGLPSSLLPKSATLARTAELQAFVALLQEEEFLDAAYWLSSAYSMLCAEEYRKSMAMYFTPPSLTRRLLDDLEAQGIDFASRSFCDPACGGAAFLAPIAQRMREALLARGVSGRKLVEHVANNVFGCDRDPVLCKLSMHFLLMVLHKEVVSLGFAPKFRIAEADSLKDLQALTGKLDVLACNPPFRKMRADEVAQYRDLFDDVIEAQPNVYGLFIGLCVRLLKPEGVAALVTPTSFLSGQYFSRLRRYIANESSVLSVGMVSDRLGVFIDVEQETALTLLKRRSTANTVAETLTSVSVVSGAGEYLSVGQCRLPNTGAAWPIPRAEQDVALIASAEALPFRLCDYGYAIKVGTYVWNRDVRTAYISEAMAKARCKTKSAVPLLWSSDVRPDGSLRFDGRKKANSERCFVNLGSRDHPSIVKRASVLLQRVTSNDQPRRLVAAAVNDGFIARYGGFVGENHTVILERVSESAPLSPSELAELLGSPVIERYFRCISGAPNVSCFELQQLPLPDPHKLKRLVTSGLRIGEAAKRLVLGSQAEA